MDFALDRGQTLGIVGESGSGKSVTSQALMGLLKGTSAQVTGQAMFQGKDLVTLPESAMRQLRGRNIGMIFQDPLSALHPFYTVGHQIAEAYLVHNKASKSRPVRPPSTCWEGWASPARSNAMTSTRTTSPAACGSGP